MYEVEVKARADHGAVRSRLETCGASHVETVRQRDTYYDAPHRSFAETDEALRIRCESGEGAEDIVELTYKGPRLDESTKTREEHEVRVAEEETTARLLEGLGFTPAATVSKDRERYTLDGCTVTLDTVEGLGTFVEVEDTVTAESAIDDARATAMETLERLGVDPQATIRRAYLTLLQES